MRALLLAAGQGTRLRPYTDRIPKPMMQIGGKPILEHNVESLSACGIKEVAINLHYCSDVIKDHFGDGAKWGVNIRYSYEESLRGTAGALKLIPDFFEETFILWYGDNLCHLNLPKLVDFHNAKGGSGTIALHWREEVSQVGIADVDDDCRILRFLEKPSPDQVFSHWVNAGVYVLEPDILNHIPEGQNYDFGRHLFPKLLALDQKLYGYRMEENEKFWLIDRTQDLRVVIRNWEGREI